MIDFATLGVRIDSRDVARGERDLDDFAGTAERTEKRVGKATAAIKTGFALAGAAIAAVIGSRAIGTISEFGQAMSRVEAISGATGRELQALRRTAQELGASTEFSAGQAADALGFLSMAGFEASESMAAIPAVLDLATASGMGLAEAADIASNVLSGFGKEAREAGNAADILAEAASTTNTSVGQLGRAMSTVAPISASLGVSMEETAAAIGVMSDAGIQGERAGTALRGVMASLAGPTDAAEEALSRYGLTIEQVNPETNDLAEIFATLAERGLTTADAMTIFGREAASGALVMVDAASRMEELTEQFERADGAASDMAETMRDNLGGDLAGLRSAVEGAIIALGDAGLTAVIRTVVQALTGLVRGMTQAINVIGRATTALANFLGLGDDTQRFASAMDALQIAVDNSTLAMGDQIRQSALLSTRLDNSNIMTVEAARVHLESARARLADVDAMRRQNEELLRQELGADTVAAKIQQTSAQLQETLANLTAFQTQLLENNGRMADGGIIQDQDVIRATQLEDQLARLLVEQKAINDAISQQNFLSDEQIALKAQIESNISRIETALRNATGETVSLNGEVTEGISLSDRLASALDGVGNFSAAGTVQQIMNIATSLGVATAEAIKLARSLPGYSAGGASGPDAAIQQTREQFNIEPIATLSFPAARSSRGGGGRGGGGGGIDRSEQAMTALDRLLGTDDPREKIESWHEEAMTALADANLIERGMMEEHNQYRLQIEQSYQDQLAELRRNQRDADLASYQSFFGSMASVLQSGGGKLLAISKGFALAEAAVSIWRGAAKALELPFPANLAAWGQVLATGAKAIQGIQSARPNAAGGINGGAAGGGGANVTRQTQVTEVRFLNGQFVDVATIANFVNQGADEGRITRFVPAA